MRFQTDLEGAGPGIGGFKRELFERAALLPAGQGEREGRGNGGGALKGFDA